MSMHRRDSFILHYSDAFLAGAAPKPTLVIAPSDLTFLLQDCLRCFWLKVVAGIPRPSTPMPAVFTRLDRIQRAYFDGKDTSLISPTLPPGRLDCSDLRVLSNPITVGASSLRIRGALDGLITFNDGTHGVVDFKTSSPKEANHTRYSNQLHAYATALEHAEWRHQHSPKVTHLGLLCFDPVELRGPTPSWIYDIDVTWIPIPRDDPQFNDTLTQVGNLLAQPKPPEPTAGCQWCTHHDG